MLATLGPEMPMSTKTTMEDAAEEKKRDLEELKAKRNQLFSKLLKNPEDIHLALEIKLIDDQIAECTRQTAQQRKGPQEGRTPPFGRS